MKENKEIMKSVKRQLNNVIKWTSSKFNVFRKADVINGIINMQVGEKLEFECGAYSEKSWNGGYHYKVYRELNKILVYNANMLNITTIVLPSVIKS